MKEGWFGNEYWSLYEGEKEEAEARAAYGLDDFLPGHRLVGLRNWDDFVVRDEAGQCFKIPTVPLKPAQMEEFAFAVDANALERDEGLEGKIKWHVTPVFFGGDGEARENLALVTPEQHAELVRWWAAFYRAEFGGEAE